MNGDVYEAMIGLYNFDLIQINLETNANLLELDIVEGTLWYPLY